MAEIKSTLDLVMEKTKHLKLSKKEKEQQRHNELKQSVKAVLQKYKDAVFNFDKIKKEINILQQSHGLQVKNIFLHEIIDAITLDQDNRPLLTVLKELFGVNVMKIESLLNEYQEIIQSAAKKRVDKLKEKFTQKQCVSGSAVVPNLEADNEWISEVQGITHQFEQSFNREKEGIIY